MASDPTTNSYDEIVKALQLTAGALQTIVRDLDLDETAKLKFTGKWERFGSVTIGEILNRCDTALEPYSGEHAS